MQHSPVVHVANAHGTTGDGEIAEFTAEQTLSVNCAFDKQHSESVHVEGAQLAVQHLAVEHVKEHTKKKATLFCSVAPSPDHAHFGSTYRKARDTGAAFVRETHEENRHPWVMEKSD